MKIIHLEKGEAYELSPDTQLQIERPNPFFNDYAEQSVPCSIPASPRNMRLCGFSDLYGHRLKQQKHDVAIQDGEYYTPCRQAVLSASKGGQISTSFYLNDGSFYSRIGTVSLKDIWTGEDERRDFGSLDSLIDYFTQMAAGTVVDPRYRIFPILLEDDSGSDDGLNYKILNNYGSVYTYRASRTDEPVSVHVPLCDASQQSFLNAEDTTEVVDGTTINVPRGYYLSPQIRVETVLHRIFNYFGYTLQTTFFDAEPFRSMVLLNTVIDSCIYGYVLNRDLVPDVTCRDFLTLFRRKFGCEFVADETTRTVTIAFFNSLADSLPAADLTDRLASHPTFQMLTDAQFKRVVLKPADSTGSVEGLEEYESAAALLADTPAADFHEPSGMFSKHGFYNMYDRLAPVGTVSGYNGGGTEEEAVIDVPECATTMRTLVYHTPEGINDLVFPEYIYGGKATTLHSKLVDANGNEISTEQEQQKPILAFTATSPIGAFATLSAYTIYDIFQVIPFRKSGRGVYASIPEITLNRNNYRRLWDYSLYYWGSSGLFERFYQQMDLLRRNALEEVKVKLLLTQRQKLTLPAHAVYSIHQHRFLLSKLKFSVGASGDDAQECDLLSMQLKQPISPAGTCDNLLPIRTAAYTWQPHMAIDGQEVDREHAWSFMTETCYPPLPDASYVGQRYGYRYAENPVSGRFYEYWLSCEPIA